jgi:hypothetical protein
MQTETLFVLKIWIWDLPALLSTLRVISVLWNAFCLEETVGFGGDYLTGDNFDIRIPNFIMGTIPLIS